MRFHIRFASVYTISVFVVSLTERARFSPSRYATSIELTEAIPQVSHAYISEDVTQISRTLSLIDSGARKFFLKKLLNLIVTFARFDAT